MEVKSAGNSSAFMEVKSAGNPRLDEPRKLFERESFSYFKYYRLIIELIADSVCKLRDRSN